MKVRELIAKLQELDPELDVMVADSDYGPGPAHEPTIHDIWIDAHGQTEEYNFGGNREKRTVVFL